LGLYIAEHLLLLFLVEVKRSYVSKYGYRNWNETQAKNTLRTQIKEALSENDTHTLKT